MKKILNILATMLLAVVVVACNSPKVIPDKVLAEIFHDALLVNAYLQQRGFNNRDSTNIYEPIFAKYGYTTEDVHYTINNFSRRKSASLGGVTSYMSDIFKEESDKLQLLVTKQDTIDHVVRRRSEKVIFHDTAIVATTKADTALLRIAVRHVKEGKYSLTGNYTLDKEDKGIGRRCHIGLMRGDSLVRTVTSTALVRGRKGYVNLNFDIRPNDSLADHILVNFHRFNLKKNRLQQTPITIHELTMKYHISNEEALRLLFNEQSQMRIFADTMLNLKIAKIDSLAADSLAVDSLAAEAIDSLTAEQVDSLLVEQADTLTSKTE